MYVQERIYNHFLNLVENKKFAKNYFCNIDINQFNNDKLIQLKRNLKKAEFEYEKMMMWLSIVKFFNINSKLSDIILKTESSCSKLKVCVNILETFEANLVFLIIMDIIKLDDCERLGFDMEYIKELVYGYKKQIKNPYVEYYYDEKTGKTLRVSANGKLVVLPYTPIVVRNKIQEERSKKRC